MNASLSLRFRWLEAAIVPLALIGGGCLRGAANQATQGVLEATAKETREHSPEVRKQTTELVVEVATDESVQRAMHDLALCGVHGAVDGIDPKVLDALTETVVKATFDAVQRHGDAFARDAVALAARTLEPLTVHDGAVTSTGAEDSPLGRLSGP